jgi:hypothetical protein
MGRSQRKESALPMTTDAQTIHHGASRSAKHISVIAYIIARGESLTPFIMIPQICYMEEIQVHFQILTQALSAVPGHFAFNLDEMDHPSWADPWKTTCYVLAELYATHITYPVSWKANIITCVTCIAVDGLFLPPALIAPNTFDDEMLLFG